MTSIHNRHSQKKQRQSLRNTLTEPERRLWYHLRAKQLGVKFRRQFGIGPYIVDFYAPQVQLVVEVDGDSHGWESATAYDDFRTRLLEQEGVVVIRFTNSEVMHNMTGVLERIVAVVTERGV